MELGDKLYYVLSDFSGVSISEITVVSIKDKYFVCKYKRTSNEELIFTNKDFGKTIFSDKKEAMKKYKKESDELGNIFGWI